MELNMKLKKNWERAGVAFFLCSMCTASNCMKPAENPFLNKTPRELFDVLDNANDEDLDQIRDALEQDGMEKKPNFFQTMQKLRNRRAALKGAKDRKPQPPEQHELLNDITSDKLKKGDKHAVSYVKQLAKSAVPENICTQLLTELSCAVDTGAAPGKSTPAITKGNQSSGTKYVVYKKNYDPLFYLTATSAFDTDSTGFETDGEVAFDVEIGSANIKGVKNVFFNRLIKKSTTK